MEKYYEEWEGKQYLVRTVQITDEIADELAAVENSINVATYDLFLAMEKAFYDEHNPKHEEAEELDNDIFYYVSPGYLETDPTDEELIWCIRHNI